MKTTLNDGLLKDVLAKLSASNNEHKKHHPGDLDARQPVHTVYGGANQTVFTGLLHARH